MKIQKFSPHQNPNPGPPKRPQGPPTLKDRFVHGGKNFGVSAGYGLAVNLVPYSIGRAITALVPSSYAGAALAANVLIGGAAGFVLGDAITGHCIEMNGLKGREARDELVVGRALGAGMGAFNGLLASSAGLPAFQVSLSSAGVSSVILGINGFANGVVYGPPR